MIFKTLRNERGKKILVYKRQGFRFLIGRKFSWLVCIQISTHFYLDNDDEAKGKKLQYECVKRDLR